MKIEITNKDKNKAREKYLVVELNKTNPHLCKIKKMEKQCRQEIFVTGENKVIGWIWIGLYLAGF